MAAVPVALSLRAQKGCGAGLRRGHGSVTLWCAQGGAGKRALPAPQAGGRVEGRMEVSWNRLGHAEVKWLP